MNRFKSRKFWLTIAAAVSLVLAETFDIHVAPEAIAGLAFIVGTYVFGQGMVDKSVVTAQVNGALDVGKAQLELYARQLEEQLKNMTAELEIEQGYNARDLPTEE